MCSFPKHVEKTCAFFGLLCFFPPVKPWHIKRTNLRKLENPQVVKGVWDPCKGSRSGTWIRMLYSYEAIFAGIVDAKRLVGHVEGLSGQENSTWWIFADCFLQQALDFEGLSFQSHLGFALNRRNTCGYIFTSIRRKASAWRASGFTDFPCWL